MQEEAVQYRHEKQRQEEVHKLELLERLFNLKTKADEKNIPFDLDAERAKLDLMSHKQMKDED